MKTSCLINNFNYGRYVTQAVESALSQTEPFDEIIVVDDGSTDDSLEVLACHYANHPRVRVISKANQGQLSCFNVGFAAATGDLLFFLDSDDVYEREYLARAIRTYEEFTTCDFLFCALMKFGSEGGLIEPYPSTRSMGYSAFSARYVRKWIGAPTSAISMRRSALERILPLPESFYSDWKSRADDCLVLGASLVGCCKVYLAETLVKYRLHGDNGFAGKKFSNFDYRLRRLNATGMINLHFLMGLSYINHNHLLLLEFSSLAERSLRDLLTYLRIVRLIHAPFLTKSSLVLRLLVSYLEYLKNRGNVSR